MTVRRFVFVVLDGVGAGALPDAAAFGDEGSDTLGNLARLVDLHLPTLQALGLGNLHPLQGVPPVPAPRALPGRLAEHSAGKDTTNGHWEHMGLVTEVAFPTYPNGFPEEVLRPLRERIGLDVLGNKAASGTEIIAELGDEHVATGRPIVYTSADSVFQIACHVGVVPLEELYRICRIAREILSGPHAVARVIARPFAGESGGFYRTPDRKDFSLEPPGPTYLDMLVARGIPVIGLGKIWQIFAGRGVTEEHKVAGNADNLERLITLLREGREGLIMTNLVDFDMAWGHRNDVEGFAAGLAAFDAALPRVLELLGPDDRLLLTADHGVDPTTVSTDHSREYVPLLYYPRPAGAPAASYEGSMYDSGATVFADLAGERPTLGGRPLHDLSPDRGWRSYPWVPACRPTAPCSIGEAEVEEAAAYLRRGLGPPPAVAVVLGSGLDRLVGRLEVESELAYDSVPGWSSSRVAGHPGRLFLCRRVTERLVVLAGRVHGYEGFDLGRQQIMVRSLARWGVGGLLLTNASGGIDPELKAGTLAVVTRVLDFQTPTSGGDPDELSATPLALYEALAGLALPGRQAVPAVTYAALPGPQYETEAEVEVLRGLGAHVVGMSTAAEVRAAADEGVAVVVVSVVTNAAGVAQQEGMAVHGQVVDVSAAAAPRMLPVLDAVLGWWSRAG